MLGSPSRLAPKTRMRVLLALLILTASVTLFRFLRITQMPLRSYKGSLPPLTAEEADLRDRLKIDVKDLSVDIGDRSFLRPQSLNAAAEYLSNRLQEQGYMVAAYSYLSDGLTVKNIEATLPGQNEAIGQVIVGAHYDSVAGTVGADDNCTGVAAALEIARLVRATRFQRTVRFVFFVNEEPPNFQTWQMGSRVYAHHLRKSGVPVSAMISLETIGFYSTHPGSQRYPPLMGYFYPNEGTFLRLSEIPRRDRSFASPFGAFANPRCFLQKVSPRRNNGRA